jgi:hypothetical protein
MSSTAGSERSSEHAALLSGLSSGLRHATDLDTIGALHSEGVSRTTVLRSFNDTRRRLEDGGAKITPEGSEGLQLQVKVSQAAEDLLTDWNAYCIVQLVWGLSAHQWLAEIEPLQLGYLGSSCVASRRMIESLLPTYWARAAGPLATDPRVPDLLLRLTDLLSTLRRGMSDHFPSRPERRQVNAATLLAS